MVKTKDPNRGSDSRTAFDGGRTQAQRVIAEHHSMESDALNFRTRWQECANYIQPRKGNILTFLSPGQPQTILVWDTTAENALVVYAAGIVSFLTPPTERWFRLQPRNKNASSEFKAWLDDCSERMASEIGSSDFYEVWHEDCLDGGCFGSSLMRVDEAPDDTESILSHVNIPVGTFYWRENNKGKISTITRNWKWTASQAEEEFGEEAVMKCEQLAKALRATDSANSNREFHFIERIKPRRKSEIVDGPTTPENRPFECLYVCVEDQMIVREDGYYENPYAGCRVMRSNNEVYGRGPGTQAMPNIKGLNRMKEDVHVIAEKMANPPWVAPDDTYFQPDNRPGGVNYYDSKAGAEHKPAQQVLTHNIKEAREEMAEDRQTVRDFYFNDMFKLLTRSDEMAREKTAYEVSQMVAERMILFSPIFGRITKEKLNPVLYRQFSIMLRNGRFKPLPMGTNPNMQFEVCYVSKIALAIKAIENQAIATAIQIIQSMVAIDPAVAYLLKGVKAARQVLLNAGVPSDWLRTDTEVAALQAKQQQEQQRLQAAQAALAGSQTIKNLGPQAQSGAASAVSAAAGTKRAA